MRILVTGGAGFIGSNLAKHYADAGHDVVAADTFHSSAWHNLADFTGDVLTLPERDAVASVAQLGPFDLISHQASITGVIDTETGQSIPERELTHRMLRSNVEVFRHLLDHAVQTQARVVWASSCSVYGQGEVPMKESQPRSPLNSYAFSKVAMERMAERYVGNLAHPIVGLRYSNVYGPGEQHKGKLASIIQQLAVQMKAGKRPRIFTAGEQKRDFVYIDDVIQANEKAVAATESGNYNAGAGDSWTFNQVVAELNRVLGTNLPPEYFENPYGFTQDWTQTDLTQARDKLGYAPSFDLAQGMDAYLASGKLGASV
ncbi:MAG: NAD-dependent epimerase/dehydratase family protein [Planctomycetota bacterium]